MYTPCFYYTTRGDSYITVMEDGSRKFSSVPNESYYRHNGVTVYVATQFQRLLGPVMHNMYIEVNGEKKDVPGWTGYYQKSGPMFTVEDGYVYTVHFDDQIKRDNRRCRINIYTLEIEYLE